MRRAGVLLAVLAAVWSAAWFVVARTVERTAETWFAEATAAGALAEYGFLRAGGFPGGVKLLLEAPRLGDPVTGLGWRGGELRAGVQAWAPQRVDVVAQGAQTLSLGSWEAVMTGQSLAGVVRLRRGQPKALLLAFRGVEVVAPQGTFVPAPLETRAALAEATLELRRGTNDLRLDLTGSGLEVSGLDWPAQLAERPETPVERVSLSVAAGFDGPPQPGAQPAWVGLETLEVLWAGGAVRGGGRLTLDGDGRPEGRIELEAEGWPPLVALAVALGLIEAEIGETWVRVLATLEAAGPKPGVLSVPVVFRDGWMSVGPLPLGRAPQLQATAPGG
ncbi:MAG: DUF2125 domain-containing protein [Alkalilacustris sp.]